MSALLPLPCLPRLASGRPAAAVRSAAAAPLLDMAWVSLVVSCICMHVRYNLRDAVAKWIFFSPRSLPVFRFHHETEFCFLHHFSVTLCEFIFKNYYKTYSTTL